MSLNSPASTLLHCPLQLTALGNSLDRLCGYINDTINSWQRKVFPLFFRFVIASMRVKEVISGWQYNNRARQPPINITEQYRLLAPPPIITIAIQTRPKRMAGSPRQDTHPARTGRIRGGGSPGHLLLPPSPLPSPCQVWSSLLGGSPGQGAPTSPCLPSVYERTDTSENIIFFVLRTWYTQVKSVLDAYQNSHNTQYSLGEDRFRCVIIYVHRLLSSTVEY